MTDDNLTPMMRQYRRIKAEHKDAVLFFRLGDFYEMFEHDAKEVSRILNITLTTRHGIPMCGIPYHASHSYIPRLLKAGKKIAVCEQIALPSGPKGIADREVVEIITPGTVVEEDYLDSKRNNYLFSLARTTRFGSISYIDLSTGEFQCASFPRDNAYEFFRRELRRTSPREIIIQESLYDEDQAVRKIMEECGNLTINRYPDWEYSLEDSRRGLTELFGTSSLKGFGIPDNEPAIFSAGVLLRYLKDTAKTVLSHIRGITVYQDSHYMGLDDSTQRNLELVRNMQDGSSMFTLLDVLDHTQTPMGGRLIRKWILQPLNDIDEIRSRLDAVELFYHNQLLMNRLRETLSEILDLERLAARVGLDKAHGKDLLSLLNSLEKTEKVIETLEGWDRKSPLWDPGAGTKKEMKEVIALLANGVHEEPSVLLTEGRLIKRGYNAELDHLKDLRQNSKEILDQYVSVERENTGIQNLKVKYNRIIGYFFDVSKGNRDLVPDYFIRRQTLVNGERFTTDRLINLESELNSASEKTVELERELFVALRNRLKAYIPAFQHLAGYIAVLDVLSSFATSATMYGYTKPELHSRKELLIREGRHPVVEKNLPPGDFIPNTLHIGTQGHDFALITGPNMAGKSTFLRQNAIIVLMAQTGSYIPAGEAKIGIVDKIFCRVGASDNLARGESTFLVEMNETANILRSATEQSLVIMDEVGRGTSTNDGLSIAWAVSDYLIKRKTKTLFATHYHELTRMKSETILNLSLEVLENEGDIVFLKRIKEGPSDNSYGIHVARLAGIPFEVIEHARDILSHLLRRECLLSGQNMQNTPHEELQGNPAADKGQGELFNVSELVIRELDALRLDTCTPLEAINTIARWKAALSKKSRE